MIQGATKNIAITPIGYKNLDKEETFVPYHIDLRNGNLTDAGNWKKRNGFSEKWDVTTNYPINLLVEEKTGYATTTEGKIYKLPSVTSTPRLLDGERMNGSYRPTYEVHNNLIILCDGGNPVKIDGDVTSFLGGSPPNAKFIVRISSYTLMAGHHDTEVKYCTTGNPENWVSGINFGDAGFFNVQKTGEKIRNMKSFRNMILLFKDKSIETWIFIGGATPFVRQDSGWINKGLGADDSVVNANDTFYWYGDDGDFYVLNGGQPMVISQSYRAELDKLVDPSSIYGFDFRKEGVIRWFAPTDGKCFVYDYIRKNVFSEDNTWNHGQWERLPINSYMELNGKQYFGDYEPTGKVFEWSEDYSDDNGTPIRVYRKFAIIPSDKGNNARFNRLRFRFKRGVATSNVTAPLFFYRYRIDDGEWTDYEYHNMGSSGDRDPWIDVYNLGIGREIEFELVETDAVDFLLTHASLTARELGN